MNKFAQYYKNSSEEAMDSISNLEDRQKCALLIDAGFDLSDPSLFDMALSILKKESPDQWDGEYYYFTANAHYWRALIKPKDNILEASFLNDTFNARINYGLAINSSEEDAIIRSMSAVNIGGLLLNSGRWIEAIDFYRYGQKAWPKNGVAFLREVECLMGIFNECLEDPDYFGFYTSKYEVNNRINELLDTLKDLVEEIREISGDDAANLAIHFLSISKENQNYEAPIIKDDYISYVKNENLALSIYPHKEDYKSMKLDSIIFDKITDRNLKYSNVPEIFSIFNDIKCNFALSRQLYYQSISSEYNTTFQETAKCTDTLDYATYSVQTTALCIAQKIAYDILDKIAVSIALLFDLKSPEKATFSNLWYLERKEQTDKIDNEIQKIILSNRSIFAIYDIHRDTKKINSNEYGFMRSIKDLRNASTHRFTVIHDEHIRINRPDHKVSHHIHTIEMESLTLSTLKIARSAIIYLCDAINRNESNQIQNKDTIVASMNAPDHDYIRGRNQST